MARRKCKGCGKWIESSDKNIVPYKDGYMHEACFAASMKAIKTNKDEKLNKVKDTKKGSGVKKRPQAALKDGLSEEEYHIKKKYYDYLSSLIDGDLTSKIYALSDNYIKRYGYSFETMYQTLVYLNEIQDYDFTDDVVGIIPYYHDKAMEFYQSIKQVEESNKGKDVKKMYQTRTIRINPQQIRPLPLLDITEITEGDDE